MQVNSQKAEKEKNSREKLFLGIIFLQFILIGVLIWQLVDKGQTNTVLTDENMQLAVDQAQMGQELDELSADFSALETDNEQMQARIDSQMARIADFKEQLVNAEGDKAKMQSIIRELRKETGTLRRIMHHYVVTIDSLNTLNVALQAEVVETHGRLDQAHSNIENLTDNVANLEGQVKIGATLQTQAMTAEAIRVRSGGGQAVTRRAKNTDMIKTCFVVRENALAKAGNRDFYVRIIKPDGTVLTPPDQDTHFEWDGGSGYYTIKHAEEYNNQAMDVCIYCEVEGEIPEGKYLAQIYADGAQIGSTDFDLK